MGILYVKKEFTYTYNFDLSLVKEFFWNTGNLSSYWYQVTGCCKNTKDNPSRDACPPYKTDDPNCGAVNSFYVQTILAYSPEDVCQQLTNNNWNWEICSLKKWSRPAENEYIINIYDDCNILKEVEFKDISECISLSVSESPDFNIKFIMTSTILYEGSGSIPLCKDGCSATLNVGFLNKILLNDDEQKKDDLIVLNETLTESNNDIDNQQIEILDNETILPDFVESSTQLNFTIPTIIVNCSKCNTLPARLYCKNNLIELNEFSNFIYNSNQKFSYNFNMIYSNSVDSWNSNFYYDSHTSNIKWQVYFSLSCLSRTETEYYWNFLMYFKKTEDDRIFDSKLGITVPSEYVCGYNSQFLFDFNFNVLNKNLYTNINYFKDDYFVFYDKIGLFSNNYWRNNPEIYIQITQNYDPNDVTRKMIVY